MDPKQVAEMFVEAGWLNAEQGHALAQEAATTGKPIENVMVDHGIVTEDQFFALIAESLGTEVVDLDAFDGASHTLHLIPGGLARLHGALPVGHADNTIYVALVDPLNPQIAEDLRFALESRDPSRRRAIRQSARPDFSILRLRSLHHGGRSCSAGRKYRKSLSMRSATTNSTLRSSHRKRTPRRSFASWI